MAANTSIFLIGPMGAGKSAVGRKLASMLDFEFADSDEEIESRTGVDIPFIFDKEGEDGFRAREAKVIDDLTRLNSRVLATGGGSAMEPESRAQMAARGLVVYLHASVEQQLERTRKGRERPLLRDGKPLQVLEKLMAIRDPQYREIADIIIETDGRQVSSVVREIEKKLTELSDA
jgi:shikimate kinase